MGTSAPTTIQHLAELLADALQQVERDFSSTTGSWDRAGNGVTFDAAQVLGLIETEVLEHLRSDASEDSKALAVLRITDDLRRIVRLTENVARRLPHPVSGVSEDLIDHLRRMIDLTAAQLGAGVDCLRGREMAQVQRVLLEESALDNWYDLLLVDVFDDLNDGQGTNESVVALLAVARTLECIGDHARHISECTLAIARAHATPSAVTA